MIVRLCGVAWGKRVGLPVMHILGVCYARRRQVWEAAAKSIMLKLKSQSALERACGSWTTTRCTID